MSESNTFYPPRRAGFIFQISAIVGLILAAIWGLLQASRAQVGPIFLMYLTPALLAIPLVPTLIYRLYTLQNSSYTIARDRIRLQWGWRVEQIPTNEILWVRPAADLEIPLHLPRFRWPGALLGASRLPDSRPVEFFASMTRQLILIGTVERAYAISPRHPHAFLQSYQKAIELGSLNLAQTESVYPSFIFARAWQARPARALLILGAVLNIAILSVAIFAVPKHPQISLGFTASGARRDPLPGVQMLFLPVFSIFIFAINSILGFVFFRATEEQPWAYILWSTSCLSAALFATALMLILQAS